jgi:Bacterial PH domain
MTVRSGARTTGTGTRSTDTGVRTTDTGVRTEVFRLAPPLVFWWVWVAFVLANVIDFAVHPGQARFLEVVCAILASGTGLAYALALRPRVLADQAGITVLNPFSTHHLPWSAVRSADVAEWVRVHYGKDKTIGCWALVASARGRRLAGRPEMPGRLPEEARRLTSLSSTQAIATRLNALARKARASADGHDGDGDAVTSRWSWPAIAAVVIPAVGLLIAVAA